MVEYRTGRIYQSDIDMILNNVSYRGKFDGKLSAKLKRDFINYHREYNKLCKERKFNDSLLGTVQIVEVQKHSGSHTGVAGAKWLVANLFTQYPINSDWDIETDYLSLKQCFLYLRTVCNATYFATKNDYWTLAVEYKIGCDDGRGNWKIIKKMIDDIFGKEEHIKVLIMTGGNTPCAIEN